MRKAGLSAGLVGRAGEMAAAQYLRGLKYELIAANYRTRFGEIDILARDGGVLVFCEVKTRKSAGFAQAREFVTAEKQRRLRAAAEQWLSENPTDAPVRFDVIEVYNLPQGRKLEHIKNAF